MFGKIGISTKSNGESFTMKISCCVFDLDGTLLTSKNHISETDKKTLRDLSTQGVKIIIATGRTNLQIAEYIYELGISDPVITCNGGYILNTGTGEVLHCKYILAEDMKSLLCYLADSSLDYLLYTTECVYHSLSSERIKFYLDYNKTAPEAFRVPILPISELPENKRCFDILKVLIHDDPAIIPSLEERFNKNNTLTIITSGPNLIDIMPSDTTKGNGIRILADYLNIPISEIVAFGDSPNDESMLKAAGYSVAMGNAVDSIKNICNFVTKTNDEYGITYALNHIINEI